MDWVVYNWLLFNKSCCSLLQQGSETLCCRVQHVSNGMGSCTWWCTVWLNVHACWADDVLITVVTASDSMDENDAVSETPDHFCAWLLQYCYCCMYSWKLDVSHSQFNGCSSWSQFHMSAFSIGWCPTNPSARLNSCGCISQITGPIYHKVHV